MTEDTQKGQSARLLVVDDDMGMRILTRESLEKEGFEIAEAESGAQALEVFEHFRPEIILMDAEMPQMDGFSTCEALRKLPEGEHAPILLVAGFDDIQSVNRAFEAGASDFCIKPINYVALVHRLRYILRASKAFKALSTSETRLRYLAYHDGLTGLPNRHMFRERLNRALLAAKRYQRNLGVLYVDLDRFKRINDTLGHDTGDAVLKAVGERLSACVRTSDSVTRNEKEDQFATVGRLAGDEFMVLLPEIQRKEDTTLVAQRILKGFAEPFNLAGQELFVSPSIGIAMYPTDGQDGEELLKNADAAMFHAKHEGRNNSQSYKESLATKTQGQLTLENELRRAVNGEELVLHYQPIVNIHTGEIVSLEALVRWQHPTRGLLYPGNFIPLAEETGLIIPVGEWVMLSACRQTRAWQEAGFPLFTVAVNFSSEQFRHGNLLRTIPQALQEAGLETSYLEMELTESSIMVDAVETINLLGAFKKMGLNLSVDDFGTGYSSLNYLKRFPLDTLKIDRSFVMDIHKQSDDSAITHAIIAMAHGLQLNVIAEGVETKEQMEFLKEHGCDEIQGYFICKPMSVDEITRYLEEYKKDRRPHAYLPGRKRKRLQKKSA